MCVKWALCKPLGKDRVCPYIQNTYCPSGFDCWDFNGGSTIHFLFCADKNPQKQRNLVLFSSSCSFYIAHFHHITRDPSCRIYSFCIASHRFQVVLLKKWENIIGTQVLHIMSIFIWGITPHRPDNLAPQIPSLSVLWSHSGWSPGWADLAWKAALFNEQWRAWVKRQQVERQIDAMQLGMDHFPGQLLAWIIIIKKVCLQKCSCYQDVCLRFHQLLGEISYIRKMLFIWLLFRDISSQHGSYPGKYWYVSDSLL